MQHTRSEGQFVPFFIAFAVTLLLMTGVLSTVVILHSTQRASATVEEYNGPSTIYLPQREDRLVFLMAASENSSTPPDVYLLAGFLPDKGTIAICTLPTKTMITAGEQSGTLEELFDRGGLGYSAGLLGSYLGIDIERTAYIEVEGLRKLVESAGFYEYELGVELDYPMHQRQVVLGRGVQQLDGRKLMDILAYPAYKGGETERCDRSTMLITRMVNDHLPDSLTAEGDVMVKCLLNNSKTDITFLDYEERKSPTRFLAQLRLPAATAVYIEGELSRDYSSFLLSESCRARLTSIYSGDGFAIDKGVDHTTARVGAYDNVTDEPKEPAE